MVLGDKKAKGITKPSTSDKGTANKKKRAGPGGALAGPGGVGSSSGKDKQVSKPDKSVNGAGGAAAGAIASPARGPS